MKKILAISKTTFQEGIRGKIYYNLLLFGLIIAASSIILSQISIGDKAKIIKDTGLSAISFLGLLIVIILGALTMHNDLEKRITYNLFSKPLSKGEYVLGKFLGVLGLILINTIIISILTTFLVYLFRSNNSYSFYQAILLILIELMLLEAVVILFSTFANINLVLLAVIATYIVGHSTTEARQIIIGKASPIIRFIFDIFYYLFPNLDYLNLKIQAAHNLKVPFTQFFYSTLYGISYTGILLFLATWIMRRRDE